VGIKKKRLNTEVNMSKVLYIAPYRTGTDYSDAAINYILALDKVGVDVVPRCSLDSLVDVPARIKELERKNSEGCDILVMHGPPETMEWYGKFKKCIGIVNIETNDIRYTSWANKLNLLDVVVVANVDAKDACIIGGVTKPIVILPYAFNMERYQRSYGKLDEIRDIAGNDFLFYTIGKSNRRRNIIDVLRAFHTEFRPEEPVNLVIKTGQKNLGPEITRNDIRKISEKIKADLRLYQGLDKDGRKLPAVAPYKEELIITEWLSDEDLCKLHNTCDAYVGVSSNENWGSATFDAMAFGKTPIAVRYAGQAMYLNDTNSLAVAHTNESCFGLIGMSDAFTAHEYWAKPNITSLREMMRLAYETRNNNPLVENGLETAYDYSYERIGEQFKELLDEQQK
jgi:glycosyltransferase involved in cell wall biosynthesis